MKNQKLINATMNQIVEKAQNEINENLIEIVKEIHTLVTEVVAGEKTTYEAIEWVNDYFDTMISDLIQGEFSEAPYEIDGNWMSTFEAQTEQMRDIYLKLFD